MTKLMLAAECIAQHHRGAVIFSHKILTCTCWRRRKTMLNQSYLHQISKYQNNIFLIRWHR